VNVEVNFFYKKKPHLQIKNFILVKMTCGFEIKYSSKREVYSDHDNTLAHHWSKCAASGLWNNQHFSGRKKTLPGTTELYFINDNH